MLGFGDSIHPERYRLEDVLIDIFPKDIGKSTAGSLTVMLCLLVQPAASSMMSSSRIGAGVGNKVTGP